MPATPASRLARGTARWPSRATACGRTGWPPARTGSRPGCRPRRAVRRLVTPGSRSRGRHPAPPPARPCPAPPWACPWGGGRHAVAGGWVPEGCREDLLPVWPEAGSPLWPAALAWPPGSWLHSRAAASPAGQLRPGPQRPGHTYHRPRACGYVWPGPGSRAAGLARPPGSSCASQSPGPPATPQRCGLVAAPGHRWPGGQLGPGRLPMATRRWGCGAGGPPRSRGAVAQRATACGRHRW